MKNSLLKTAIKLYFLFFLLIFTECSNYNRLSMQNDFQVNTQGYTLSKDKSDLKLLKSQLEDRLDNVINNSNELYNEVSKEKFEMGQISNHISKINKKQIDYNNQINNQKRELKYLKTKKSKIKENLYENKRKLVLNNFLVSGKKEIKEENTISSFSEYDINTNKSQELNRYIELQNVIIPDRKVKIVEYEREKVYLENKLKNFRNNLSNNSDLELKKLLDKKKKEKNDTLNALSEYWNTDDRYGISNHYIREISRYEKLKREAENKIREDNNKIDSLYNKIENLENSIEEIARKTTIECNNIISKAAKNKKMYIYERGELAGYNVCYFGPIDFFSTPYYKEDVLKYTILEKCSYKKYKNNKVTLHRNDGKKGIRSGYPEYGIKCIKEQNAASIEINKKNNEINNIEVQINLLEAKKSSAIRNIQEYSTKINTLRRNLGLNNKIIELNKEISSIDLKIEEIKTRNDNLISLKNKLSSIQQNINFEENKYNKERNELNHLDISLNNKSNTLSNEISEIVRTNNNLETQNKKLIFKKKKYRKYINNKQNSLTTLRKKIEAKNRIKERVIIKKQLLEGSINTKNYQIDYYQNLSNSIHEVMSEVQNKINQITLSEILQTANNIKLIDWSKKRDIQPEKRKKIRIRDEVKVEDSFKNAKSTSLIIKKRKVILRDINCNIKPLEKEVPLSFLNRNKKITHRDIISKMHITTKVKKENEVKNKVNRSFIKDIYECILFIIILLFERLWNRNLLT